MSNCANYVTFTLLTFLETKYETTIQNPFLCQDQLRWFSATILPSGGHFYHFKTFVEKNQFK